MATDDCPNKENNANYCNCSYPSCEKKLNCCECLHFHRKAGELPACFFTDEDEKIFDRSVEKFKRTKMRK
jgi:hypothetical protein